MLVLKGVEIGRNIKAEGGALVLKLLYLLSSWCMPATVLKIHKQRSCWARVPAWSQVLFCMQIRGLEMHSRWAGAASVMVLLVFIWQSLCCDCFMGQPWGLTGWGCCVCWVLWRMNRNVESSRNHVTWKWTSCHTIMWFCKARWLVLINSGWGGKGAFRCLVLKPTF